MQIRGEGAKQTGKTDNKIMQILSIYFLKTNLPKKTNYLTLVLIIKRSNILLVLGKTYQKNRKKIR